MEAALVACLEASLSPSTEQVKQAEIQLKQAARAPGYVSVLVKVMSAQTHHPPHIKQAASVQFKNYVKHGWDPEHKENDALGVAIPDNDKATIRQHLVGLMCSANPNVMSQLAEALRIISTYDFPGKRKMILSPIVSDINLILFGDVPLTLFLQISSFFGFLFFIFFFPSFSKYFLFPDRWQELLPDLISRLAEAMQSNNWSVYNGVLETANSIFKRFRYVSKSDELFTQLNYIFSIFCDPMLKHFQHLGEKFFFYKKADIILLLIICSLLFAPTNYDSAFDIKFYFQLSSILSDEYKIIFIFFNTIFFNSSTITSSCKNGGDTPRSTTSSL